MTPLEHVAVQFDMPPCPGPVCVVANKNDYRIVAPPSSTIIATLDALDIATPYPARLFGVYSDNAVTLGAALTRASTLKTRVFANADGEREVYPAQMLNRLQPWHLPTVELYWYEGESLAQIERRWDRLLEDLLGRWPWDVAVATQAYRMNTLRTVAQILDLQPRIVAAVNRAGRRVKVVLPFAWDRKDGGQQPPLAVMIQGLAAASPGLPTLEPIGPWPSRFPQATIFKRSAAVKEFKVYLKFRGKYIGVDPSHPDVVYTDRTSANGWEAVTLKQRDDKRFSAWFDAAQRFLSITDLGELQTRTAVGAWESHLAIDPPTEYAGTPSQLFQPDHGTILEVEIQK